MPDSIGSGFTDGSAPWSVSHVQVVALYEPDSGLIRHMHVVTSMGGAAPATPEEALAEARARAHERLGDLAVAYSNDPTHAELPHRIQPDTGEFVPLPSNHSQGSDDHPNPTRS